MVFPSKPAFPHPATGTALVTRRAHLARGLRGRHAGRREVPFDRVSRPPGLCFSPEPAPVSPPGPTPIDLPSVSELLAAAVAGIGGAERSGQVAMAEAVEHAIASGEHLAVQAGTGTGKSLAYLVPAIRHAVSSRSTVVVATATIALQRQLIDRDLPRLVTALAPAAGPGARLRDPEGPA